MLKEFSGQERAIFLFKFTEELIRHSRGIELYRLEEIVRKKLGLPSPTIKDLKKVQKEDVEEKIKELLLKKSENLKEEIQKEAINLGQQNKNQIFQKQIEQKKVFLKIPEPMFSEKSNYLKFETKKLNLGKINILINDLNVDSIECSGENKKIIVNGKMGKKPTAIELNKEEINNIFDEFSKASMIPLNQRVNKISVGNLDLTTIISDEENHFIIKKMRENSSFELKPPSP